MKDSTSSTTPRRDGFPSSVRHATVTFNRAIAQNYGVTLASTNEPTIFITKKHKGTLENLRDWIRDQNQAERAPEPLLLIDDEADNASINTSKDPTRSTAINTVIREILQLFDRSSYVGYTATPFANIFIDPDSDDEMLGDELFPRNFIKALDPTDELCRRPPPVRRGWRSARHDDQGDWRLRRIPAAGAIRGAQARISGRGHPSQSAGSRQGVPANGRHPAPEGRRQKALLDDDQRQPIQQRAGECRG